MTGQQRPAQDVAPGRIPGLDALRGVAAATVVLQHAMETIGLASSDINARSAVILFFVLSGFVLALPYVDNRADPWWRFLVRRFLRLWPPAAVAIGIAALLFAAIGSQPPYLGLWWAEPLSLDLLSRCLLFSGSGTGCSVLVMPLWSLIYEARISLIFPLLVWMTLRETRSTLIAMIIIGFGIEVQAMMSGRIAAPIFADDLISSVNVTLHFMALFVMGIALASARDRIRASIGAWSTARIAIAVLFALVLLALPSDMLRGAGGALLIAVVVGSPWASRVLGWGPLHWLGRVSFSLYLIHQPILAAFVYWFGGPLSVLQAGIAVICGIAMAELLYRAVERPAILLGRRIP